MCCAKIKNPFLGCRASWVKWIPLFLCRAAGPLVQTKLCIGPISCGKGCRRRLGIRKRSAYLSMPSHMRRNAMLFQDSPVFLYRIQRQPTGHWQSKTSRGTPYKATMSATRAPGLSLSCLSLSHSNSSLSATSRIVAAPITIS